MSHVENYCSMLETFIDQTIQERLSEAIATADAWSDKHGHNPAMRLFVWVESVQNHQHQLDLVAETQKEYIGVTAKVFTSTVEFQSQEANALLRLLYYVQHATITLDTSVAI